jgi:CRP/FNR family cyclic AMP-dependent transcriptional regulator
MALTTVDELTARVPLLQDLPPECLRLVAGCASTEVFAVNEHVAREGTPANTFYALREGRVLLEVRGPRRAIALETLGPGDVLGWSWLFEPYQWQFDVRALEQTRAIAFDAACLRTKIAADHELGYELLRRFAGVMLDRLQAARLRLLDIYGNPAG